MKSHDNTNQFLVETDDSYLNFINSRKTESTKTTYKQALESYLFNKTTSCSRSSSVDNQGLRFVLSISTKDSERMIIKYIEHMKVKDRSYS